MGFAFRIIFLMLKYVLLKLPLKWAFLRLIFQSESLIMFFFHTISSYFCQIYYTFGVFNWKKWPILRNLTFYIPSCSKKLIVHCLVGVLTHARKAKPSLTANNINTSACNNAHWWILKDFFLIFLKVSNFLINKICQVSVCWFRC